MRIIAAFVFLCAAFPVLANEPTLPKAIDLSGGQDASTPQRPRDGEWEWTKPAAPPEPPAKVEGNVAGRWILPGGDCRTPDLTLSADGKSVATQSHSTSDDGTGRKSSSSTFVYSYSSDGNQNNASRRWVEEQLGGGAEPAEETQSAPSTAALARPPATYSVVDGQLVVGSFGARKVYRRCDGDRPAGH